MCCSTWSCFVIFCYFAISAYAAPLGLVFVIFCYIDISAYAAPLGLIVVILCYIDISGNATSPGLAITYIAELLVQKFSMFQNTKTVPIGGFRLFFVKIQKISKPAADMYRHFECEAEWVCYEVSDISSFRIFKSNKNSHSILRHSELFIFRSA